MQFTASSIVTLLLLPALCINGLLLHAKDDKALAQTETSPAILVVDHVPKCGGTFVTFMANMSVDPSSLQLVHESAQLKREDTGPGKMVLGMIRNPFEYYISIWAYLGYMRRLTPEEFLEIRPLGYPAGTDPEDAARFGKFLKYFSDKDLGLLSFLIYYSYLDFQGLINETDYDYKGTVADAFGNTTEGLVKKQQVIAAMKNFSAQGEPVDCWVHTENATEDTRSCFSRFAAMGGLVNFTDFDLGLSMQVLNAKEHLGCSALYTNETLDFVRSSDSELFRAFGYSTDCTS
mmetsp:Transcript_56445/g.104499  ORF Transcript_56445/g.104499 Transcript_56445/m.104499 type:complete len:290 (+) Transcript_56445:64-933(+)